MSDLQSVDFFTDESLLEDPDSYYEFVRSHGPVWQEPVHGVFYVTGYEEICSVFRDPQTFSSVNAFWPFLALPEAPHGDDVGQLIEKYRHVYPGSSFPRRFGPSRAHRASRIDEPAADTETPSGERGVHVARRRCTDR